MERNINFWYVLLFAMLTALTVHPQASKVDVIINKSGNFELQRNGIPY